MTRWLVLALASGGYISYIPYRIVPFAKWKGGGFLGSALGVVLFWFCPWTGPVLWIATMVLVAAAVAVSHYAEKLLGNHDDPRIVIDEVVGVWLAALAVPKIWLWLAAAFVFFRIFDVWKGPWGRWAARAPGGWGVVLDDVLAGILAHAAVRLVMALGPWF
jgi:phosphatidylglycerophosphatase A